MEARGAFGQAKQEALDFQPLPYMKEYLAELEARDLHRAYIRTVKNGMAHFADFLRTENVMHPEEITRAVLIRYVGFCNNQDWSDGYRAQMLKKVRQWCNWLSDLDYIPSNPWKNIKISVPSKKPKPLADDDVISLFATHNRGMYQVQPFIFHRREIILCLLYGWGLRLHELAALNMSNMDLRLDFVTVKNKGGGVKHLPYSDEIKRSFQRWDSARARYAKYNEDALLITNQGERLGEDNIYRIVHDLGQEAGVQINPHRMRDTCATNLLDDDVAVERVAALLGHSNTQMTLAYAKVNNKAVKAAHAKSMDPRLANLFHRTGELVEE